MDTLSAFAMGRASAHKPIKCFDWSKARQLLEDRQPDIADAGLLEDLEWTQGGIWDNGPVTDSYVYLSSTWATPVLIIDGEPIECWLMSVPNFDPEKSWPKDEDEE